MDIQQIYYRFPTKADCIAQLEKIRWNGTPQCPYCGQKRCTALFSEYRYHCNKCNVKFSVMVNTVFHHTHLPLQKWFLAIFLLLNTRKRVSTLQLAAALGINKNTAWRVNDRVREAMRDVEQRRLIQELGVSL